jgi:DNA repair exonuclease SbcCD nuclease subunit
MDGIKILHTGDLHLGMSFAGSKLPAGVGRIRRQELWETFDRIIQTAKAEKVDILLIAGDLFEYNYCTAADILRINDRFAKIPDIRVCIAPGNHDPVLSDSLYNTCRWQPNVHIFRSRQIQNIMLDELNTCVWGLGWDSGEIRDPLLADFEAGGGGINILLAHCDVVPKGSRSDYLPVHTGHLAGCDVDYAALGHIHKGGKIEHSGKGAAVYCGSPEPLDFSENGEHGIYLGTLGRDFCDVKFMPIAKRKFVTERIPLDAFVSQDWILEQMRTHINLAGRGNLFRFLLEGSVDPGVELDTVYMEQAVSAFHTEIRNKTLPGYDLDTVMAEGQNSIMGIFTAKILQALERETDPGKRAVLERALYIGLDALNGRKVIGR